MKPRAYRLAAPTLVWVCRPHSQKVLWETAGRPLLKTFCWFPATLRLTGPMRPTWVGGPCLASPVWPLTLLPPPRLQEDWLFSSSSDVPHWLHLQPSALLSAAPHLARSSDFFRPETAPSPRSHLCLAGQLLPVRVLGTLI